MIILKKMKKRHLLIISVIISSFLIGLVVQAVAAPLGEPGSDSDPIVSQSYVDKKVNDLNLVIQDLTNKFTDLTTKSNDLTTKVTDLTTKNSDLATKLNALTLIVTDLQSKSGTVTSGGYKLITVDVGKQLITDVGTEIIVRIGSAKLIKGKNGCLADITLGKDLVSTSTVLPNHLLLSGQNDGRGIKAVKKLWLFVRGTYTIK